MSVKTCLRRLPHSAAHLRTENFPGPACQSSHSSPEIGHWDPPDTGTEIPGTCPGSPAPEDDMPLNLYSFDKSGSRHCRQGGHFQTYLFGDSRELHDMERLIIRRSTLASVDDHWSSSFAAENSLEELGQFALSKRDASALHSDWTKERLNCTSDPRRAAKTTVIVTTTDCTFRSDCCAGRWCTSPGWGASCLCFLLLLASRQRFWFCCIFRSQPSRTEKTWGPQILFCYGRSLLLAVMTISFQIN